MKNRIITTVLAVSLVASSCQKDDLVNATMGDQTREISSLYRTFDKNYGGSQEEEARAIASSKDGSYVIAGRTFSNDGDIIGNHGAIDGFLIKLDKQGNKLWQKSYGGSKRDEIFSITTTREGGYIFTGATQSCDGDLAGQSITLESLWIVKVDCKGNIEWTKVLKNKSEIGGFRRANSIIQTHSGDYIIAGREFNADTTVNGWVCKLNNSGSILWEKTTGGIEDDRFQQVVEDQAGNLWLVGTFGKPYSGPGDPITRGDVWLVKVDQDGNIAWQKQYGGDLLDEGYSLAIDRNRGIILAGTTFGGGADVVGFHGGREDAWVIKVDMDGKKIWQKCAGGTRTDLFFSVIALQNGGYLLAGVTNSQDGDVKSGTNLQNDDGWVVKLSDSGGIQWEKTYGGSSADGFYCMTQGSGKNYAVGGIKHISGVDFNAWLIGIGTP